MKISPFHHLAVSIVLAAMLFTGCSTTDESRATAATAFAQRVNSGPVGHLTYYRKSAFVGYALDVSVHVNGIEVGELSNGTYLTVKAPVGPVRVRGDEQDDELLVHVEAGKTTQKNHRPIPCAPGRIYLCENC